MNAARASREIGALPLLQMLLVPALSIAIVDALLGRGEKAKPTNANEVHR